MTEKEIAQADKSSDELHFLGFRELENFEVGNKEGETSQQAGSGMKETEQTTDNSCCSSQLNIDDIMTRL